MLVLPEFENYDIAAEPGPLSITDKHRDLEGIVPESAETNVSSFETAQNISMQEPDTSESNTEEDQLESLSQKSVSSPLIDEQKKAGDGYSGSKNLATFICFLHTSLLVHFPQLLTFL